MTAISLKKVTIVVVTCIIGSYLANANSNEIIIKDETSKEIKNHVIEVKGEKNHDFFAPLIEKFDADNNGVLSEGEIKASEKAALISDFSKIDSNKDLVINQDEFEQYIAQIK